MFNSDKKKIKIIMAIMMALLILSCVGCGKENKPADAVQTEGGTSDEHIQETKPEPIKTDTEIIGDALLLRGKYGNAANKKIAETYEEVSKRNPELGQLWARVDEIWKNEAENTEINYNELPYDLSDGSNLAIVILGYGLKKDGTMKDELVDRLRVGMNCALEYPNAYVICTGGGSVPDAKEADVMGQWLLDEGLEEERLILENKSMTTGQNAINTLQIIQEYYPEIDEIAIVTSDYHIPWAQILFKAESLIVSQNTGREINIVAHAANETGKKVDTEMSKAAGLLELLGDSNRAAEIYRKDYSSVPEMD